MTATDLHIAERLQELLPPLTQEEQQQLKENLESVGRVRDPILYWHDGERNVVIDGMHRWEIVRGTSIPFHTEQMDFSNYDEAEIWILNHQLGRRNLLKPAAIREIRGKLYNRLKTSHGGDRKSEKSKCQSETLIGDAATEVAEKAGVSRSTIIRDGDHVKTLESLTKAARSVAENASDKDVKLLASLSASGQDAVARAVRVGKAPTISDAIKLIGAKPGRETSEGPSRTPAEEFEIQKSKTVKTAEALMRAFADLHALKKCRWTDARIDMVKDLIDMAKSWPK